MSYAETVNDANQHAEPKTRALPVRKKADGRLLCGVARCGGELPKRVTEDNGEIVAINIETWHLGPDEIWSIGRLHPSRRGPRLGRTLGLGQRAGSTIKTVNLPVYFRCPRPECQRVSVLAAHLTRRTETL